MANMHGMSTLWPFSDLSTQCLQSKKHMGEMLRARAKLSVNLGKLVLRGRLIVVNDPCDRDGCAQKLHHRRWQQPKGRLGRRVKANASLS
jgi:hypothetical protein